MTNPSDPPHERRDREAAAFRDELLSGRLRWLFTALAAVSVATSVWTFLDPQLEVWFPFHAAGRTLQWLVLAGAAIWIFLAALNWRNWGRTKRARH